MIIFLKVNLLIFSLILFEFVGLAPAKADKKINYECPSLAGAALGANYSLRAFDGDIWELSKKDSGVFYVSENTEVCSYKIFANISYTKLDLSEFINKWHMENLIGKIYRQDDVYVLQNSVVLPHASEQLLKVNISLFDRTASNLLSEIDKYEAKVSFVYNNQDVQNIDGWFKASVLACPDVDVSCITLQDEFGPYKTLTECYERTKEMVGDVRDILGDGEYDTKCEPSI